tara:strand:- start:143 stop:373 length:231 start_codon:yes stop_codon:yes gene_type:complete
MQDVCSQTKLFEPTKTNVLTKNSIQELTVDQSVMHNACYRGDSFNPWEEEPAINNSLDKSKAEDCIQFDLFSNLKH